MVVGGAVVCCYGIIGLKFLQATGYAVITWRDHGMMLLFMFLGSVVYHVQDEVLAGKEGLHRLEEHKYNVNADGSTSALLGTIKLNEQEEIEVHFAPNPTISANVVSQRTLLRLGFKGKLTPVECTKQSLHHLVGDASVVEQLKIIFHLDGKPYKAWFYAARSDDLPDVDAYLGARFITKHLRGKQSGDVWREPSSVRT